MIDPKSLRIGNYLLNPYTEAPEEVVKIGPSTAKNTKWEINEEHPDFFRPIPLSEQELIRLGWQSIGELHPTFKLWNYLLEEDMLRTGKYYLRQIINKEDSLVIAGDLLYVHELQNIFHDLKRKELEYKVDSGLTPTEQDEDLDPVVKLKPVSEYEIKVTSIKKVTPTEPDTKEHTLNFKIPLQQRCNVCNSPVVGSNGITDPPFKTEEA